MTCADTLLPLESTLRVLAASGVFARDGATRFISSIDPAIAAIAGISPADACAVASAADLRYAVQCFDAPERGKAILWKASIPLHGLYRAEFEHRGGDAKQGLLRITLLWGGRPLDIVCTELSNARPDADRQLADVARTLQASTSPSVLAIAAPAGLLASLRGSDDVAATAPWRRVVLPVGDDVALHARRAFGLGPLERTSGELPRRAMRLFCAGSLAAVGVCECSAAASPSFDDAMYADLTEAGSTTGSPHLADEDADTPASRRRPALYAKS